MSEILRKPLFLECLLSAHVLAECHGEKNVCEGEMLVFSTSPHGCNLSIKADYSLFSSLLKVDQESKELDLHRFYHY